MGKTFYKQPIELSPILYTKKRIIMFVFIVCAKKLLILLGFVNELEQLDGISVNKREKMICLHGWMQIWYQAYRSLNRN